MNYREVDDTIREWCSGLGYCAPVLIYLGGEISLGSRDVPGRKVIFGGSHSHLTRITFEGGDYNFVITTSTLDEGTKEMILRWVIQGLR